ncbi:MAG TPA: PD-(D/E)XK nuclease family protein [Acidimicrobiales bacterium]|nr:PD-(D/E)XK nuclease family protein [Acidimicrobiales bacterium]
MSVRTRWVGYGQPAAQALRQAIDEAKAGDPLSPVSVVVPSNHVGVATRRLLASGSLGPLSGRGTGMAAVNFLTVYRLGELLGAATLAGQGRRPVSTPVIGAALRAALAVQPGVFAPVATHPATETALIGAYRELRDLSGATLQALADQSRRAADVVRLHQTSRRQLEHSWYDEEDLLDAAVVSLVDDRAAELGSVLVYLPQRVSRHGARLLGAVAGRRSLSIIAGTTGVETADREVVLSVRRLDGSPAYPDHGPPEPAVVDADRTRIVTASDADEEVRAGLRRVMDAVRAGTPLDRIAVLFASPEPYGRLAHEQLAAADVATNGTAIMPLSARIAGRTLLGLLALPAGDFRRDEVFAWMAGARLFRQGRAGPIAAWERLSRDAGVVTGRDQWDRLLARFAEELESDADADGDDADAPAWRADRWRASAQQARELRTFVLDLIDDLGRAASAPRAWPAWARWGRDHLDGLLGGEAERRGWPPVEQRAAERVERALDRLACLGQVEGSVGLDVFTRTLELELEVDLGRVGRMGEGVLVAPISMGVGLALDLVVVLGLAEGVLPTPTRDDSLLPDRERSATGEDLPLRAEGVERQHRQLLAAMAASSRQILCVPRGDLRGSKERIPCRWVLQVAGTLSGQTWYSEDLLAPHRSDAPWLEHVASFDAGLRSVTFPVSDQEYRLRSLLSAGPNPTAVGGPATDSSVADAVFTAGTELIAARRGRRFTRFDGNLAGLDVPSPAAGVTSATRIEGWVSCPFAYLLHDLLDVEEVENPEEELEITPLTRGSLVHDVLERFITEVLARPATEQPAPSQPWTRADRRRLIEIAEHVCSDYEHRGMTGRPIFWQRDKRRLVAELLQALDLDDRHRAAHAARPVAAELAFGFPGSAVGTVAIDLPDGRCVHFRGRADRVDVGADGTVHVVDYKTGKADGYRDLAEDNPDQGGRRFQLLVYGQAARALRGDPDLAVRAEYWFVSSKGKFKQIGYRVTPEVLARVGETLGTIVEGIEGGVFPPYPTATSTTPRFVACSFCDPDGLGVVDLRRAWERKLDDPGLAGFVGLVEPGNGSGPGAAGG